MILLGLTGSIGMGKTTTAQMFAEEGAAVWSADAAVHQLYARRGAAVPLIRATFPSAVRDGAVDRAKLTECLKSDRHAFKRLEAIVHPLVALSRTDFLSRAVMSGKPVAVLDIPLLFETRGDAMVDAVVVVTAPQEVQRERVLARPDMTPEKLATILARQKPDAEKRALADFVIDTSLGLDAARARVREILGTVTAPGFRSRRQPLDARSEPTH